MKMLKFKSAFQFGCCFTNFSKILIIKSNLKHFEAYPSKLKELYEKRGANAIGLKILQKKRQ